jgi:hypothetical protein
MFGGGTECDLMDDDGWMRDKKSRKSKDAKDMLLRWEKFKVKSAGSKRGLIRLRKSILRWFGVR